MICGADRVEEVLGLVEHRRRRAVVEPGRLVWGRRRHHGAVRPARRPSAARTPGSCRGSATVRRGRDRGCTCAPSRRCAYVRLSKCLHSCRIGMTTLREPLRRGSLHTKFSTISVRCGRREATRPPMLDRHRWWSTRRGRCARWCRSGSFSSTSRMRREDGGLVAVAAAGGAGSAAEQGVAAEHDAALAVVEAAAAPASGRACAAPAARCPAISNIEPRQHRLVGRVGRARRRPTTCGRRRAARWAHRRTSRNGMAALMWSL